MAGLLAAGTNKGRIAMWRRAAGSDQSTQASEGKEKWKLQAPTELEGNVTQIQVSQEKSCMSVGLDKHSMNRSSLRNRCMGSLSDRHVHQQRLVLAQQEEEKPPASSNFYN